MTLSTLAEPTVRDATVNKLLALLSPADFGRIAMELESVRLSVRQVLYEPGEPIKHVYFPTAGCVSMIRTVEEGAVEVGTIGFEGFVGIPVLLSGEVEPTRAFVQVPGEGYRLTADAFRLLVSESEAIRRVFQRYALTLYNQVAQSVVCNRLHALEARCARWLLITHDRVDGDHFTLTQEFLSYMLGVHRPAVTIAAGALQSAGFIRYSRGRVSIVDREGLEGASCGCYQATVNNYRSLIG
ncbi:MAG: Crp/Fnr family transcriptional regulator [Frankiales bacterium]|nr:Crp/Fnr family transcriptional regulator [Frankiales bacterium]